MRELSYPPKRKIFFTCLQLPFLTTPVTFLLQIIRPPLPKLPKLLLTHPRTTFLVLFQPQSRAAMEEAASCQAELDKVFSGSPNVVGTHLLALIERPAPLSSLFTPVLVSPLSFKSLAIRLVSLLPFTSRLLQYQLGGLPKSQNIPCVPRSSPACLLPPALHRTHN